MKDRFSRRHALKLLGGSAAALPFLPLSAEAGSDFPRRLIFVHTPNGTVMDSWWPSAGLSDLGPILSPLEDYKDRLLVMRGIDMDSLYINPRPKDHWPDTMNALTGRQGIIQEDQKSRIGGISIDQHIVNELPQETPFRSVHLGAHTSNNNRLCATGPNASIPPINDPQIAFAQLFADLKLDPFELAALRTRRKSVLDNVASDLQSVRQRVSGSYREKLDKHLDAIRSVEEGLDIAIGEGCVAPELDDVGHNDASAYPDLIEQHFDITKHALSCDLARVVTLQLGGRKLHPTWIDIDHSHHGISHGSEGVTAAEDQREEWLIAIETWYATMFKGLLDRLDSVPEGGGTMLDNSLVVWLHEQSNGGNHNRRDMPYVLAGGLAGRIEMGRRINFGGVPHNRMLTSFGQAMGVPVEQFGDPRFDSSPLPELFAL